MQITLKNWDLNAAEGSLTAEFEFVPANPIEHAVLIELLTDQALEKAFAHTTHDGDRLGIKLIFSDRGVLARAQHNLENLRRKDAGLPSLEEEQAAKAAAEAEAKAAADALAKAQAQPPPAEPAKDDPQADKPVPRPATTGKPRQSDR